MELVGVTGIVNPARNYGARVASMSMCTMVSGEIKIMLTGAQTILLGDFRVSTSVDTVDSTTKAPVARGMCQSL